MLLDAPPEITAETFPRGSPRFSIPHLRMSRCRATRADLRGKPVFVPFGGSEHDWAALELGAWFAWAVGVSLTLVGTRRDPDRGSRLQPLLADASLAVQRVVGVDTEPLLVDRTEHALIAALEPAGVVVAGISERWRRTGSAILVAS